MTLQQREPFEDLAKKAAPIRKVSKTYKNESLSRTTEVEERNHTIQKIVEQSLLNKSK